MQVLTHLPSEGTQTLSGPFQLGKFKSNDESAERLIWVQAQPPTPQKFSMTLDGEIIRGNAIYLTNLLHSGCAVHHFIAANAQAVELLGVVVDQVSETDHETWLAEDDNFTWLLAAGFWICRECGLRNEDVQRCERCGRGRAENSGAA